MSGRVGLETFSSVTSGVPLLSVCDLRGRGLKDGESAMGGLCLSFFINSCCVYDDNIEFTLYFISVSVRPFNVLHKVKSFTMTTFPYFFSIQPCLPSMLFPQVFSLAAVFMLFLHLESLNKAWIWISFRVNNVRKHLNLTLFKSLPMGNFQHVSRSLGINDTYQVISVRSTSACVKWAGWLTYF